MSENEFVKTRTEDGIGIVTVDHPPVNALNSSVLEQLDKAIDQVAENNEVIGIVITGGGNNAFCDGADIKSFSQLTNQDDVLAVIELGQKAGFYGAVIHSGRPGRSESYTHLTLPSISSEKNWVVAV